MTFVPVLFASYFFQKSAVGSIRIKEMLPVADVHRKQRLDDDEHILHGFHMVKTRDARGWKVFDLATGKRR